MEKGKLIVLEGGDGAGKTTQARLLVEALEKETPVTAMKFPRKGSAFGALVYECLDGHHGDFLELSPYLASLPYIIDQATARKEIEQALTQGHVICDRYVPSNLAFQAAKASGQARKNVTAFIEKTTYDELNAVRPDIVIYLDVPPRISDGLVGSAKDQHEKDMQYQEVVHGIYQTLTEERDKWYRIDCIVRGTLRTRDDIHQEVFAVVKKALHDS
jgi:dTMP kinase